MWRKKGESLPVGQARCHECRRANPVHKVDRDGRGSERICPVCGETFRPCRSGRTEDGWTEVCDQICGNVLRLREAGVQVDLEAYLVGKNVPAGDRNRLKMTRQRAIRRAAFVEKVDRLVVFERDNWICHICGALVDKTLPGSDLMGPTIDHVIPFSQGGKDCYDNVALAHKLCNCQKWVKLLEVGEHADGQHSSALQES